MRMWGTVAAVLAAGMCLTGCSQGSGKKTVLQYTVWGDAEESAIIDKYVALYQQRNPGVQIKVINTGGQNYSEKFLAMCAAGTGPDVFYVPPAGLLNYIAKGVMMPLDGFMDGDASFDKSDFLDRVFEPYIVDGKTYGVPRADQTMVMFYNRNMFKAAGLKDPGTNWTWNDFLAASAKLCVDRDGDGVYDQYAYAVPINWWGFYQCVWSHGGEIFSKDLKKCLINTPKTLAILQWWVDYVRKHKYSPVLIGPQSGNHQAFFAKQVAMYPMGMWVVTQFNKMIRDFEWDAALFPKDAAGKRRSLAFYAGWGINSKTKHPEAAWDFLKFISGREVQEMVVASMHDVPPLKSVAYSDKFLTPTVPPANDRAFLDMMPDRMYLPRHEKLEEINAVIEVMFQEMMTGTRPVKAIADEMTAKIDRLLAQER
jgi:multiple sugar transport system substrate-binding protein